MEEKYIDNSIAESMRSIIELCFSILSVAAARSIIRIGKCARSKPFPLTGPNLEERGEHYVF